MTTVPIVALVLTLAAVLAVGWVRGRLAAAEAGRVEIEAFRVSLGLPVDRFRVIDDNPFQAWRARRGVRSFAATHAVPRPVPAVPVGLQR